MTKRLTWTTSMIAASALTAFACGGEKTTPSEGASSAGGEPAIVITDQAEWDSLAAAGKESFDTACGACHPGGEADLGPAIKGHMEPMAEMHRQIREGSGRMKPVGEDRLPEDQMRGLMVYLASIGAVGDVKGP